MSGGDSPMSGMEGREALPEVTPGSGQSRV